MPSTGTPNISDAVIAWMSMPSAKACLQLRDVGDMGEHAQLDLAVVGRDQLVALVGDEGACGSCAPPRCGSGCSAGSARRRTAARSSSRRARRRCGRASSRDGCRPAARRCRSISASTAAAIRGSCAAARGPLRRDPRARCAPVDHCAGRGLLAAGQAHLAEQDVAELLGRADVEALAGELDRSRPRAAPPCANSPESRDSICAVDRDAALLHAREHRHQRRSSRS